MNKFKKGFIYIDDLIFGKIENIEGIENTNTEEESVNLIFKYIINRIKFPNIDFSIVNFDTKNGIAEQYKAFHVELRDEENYLTLKKTIKTRICKEYSIF